MNMSIAIRTGACAPLLNSFFRVSLAALMALVLGACASSPGSGSSEADNKRKAAEYNTSLGLEYMRRGQYEIALGKLKKATQEDPDYAPAQTVTAVLYERIGEIELAGKHYRKAVEADPDDGDVNNNYGVYLCQTGSSDKANGYFMKALDDPFYSSPSVALTNAGTCALNQGDLEQAEVYLRDALRVEPEFADALIAMANLNYQNNAYLTARAFMQRYEDTAPHTPASLLLAYRIEIALGDEQSASRYRRALSTEFPDSEQAAEVRKAAG